MQKICMTSFTRGKDDFRDLRISSGASLKLKAPDEIFSGSRQVPTEAMRERERNKDERARGRRLSAVSQTQIISFLHACSTKTKLSKKHLVS